MAAALALMLVGPRGAPAHADGPRPIRVELARGPLITSSRITGLGGAYAGVAVGIDGVWRNPATLANRPDYSTDWLDWDVTFDWLIVAADEVDFDGDGRQVGTGRDFRAVSLGLDFQLGGFAIGLLGTSLGYGATATAGSSNGDAGPAIDVSTIDLLFGAAWAADDGQWIVGGGFLASILDVTAPFLGPSRIELVGSAFDVGLLVRPRERPWRVGGRVRFGADLALDKAADPPSLPADVSSVGAAIPWEVALGASLMLAADPARQYNPRLRAAPPVLVDHRYLLLSAELTLTGATHGASLEALVDGDIRSAGGHATASIHLGAEGEVFDDRVRARVGTYFEPNRVAAGLAGRLHLTGGVEVRLFEAIWMWKATFGFDLAPGWENVSIGVGFWK